MGEDTIETGVDKLLALFKGNERISVSAAAKRLGVPEDVIQSWVDFLVEEKILGLEYKFTKPYIYLNRAFDIKPTVVKEERPTIQNFKEDFFNRARDRKLPQSKIPQFWKDHLRRELEAQKDFFFAEAKRRKMNNPDILWEKYVKQTLEA
ncbi:hypothetical protein D6783_03650 [Candidatus Woesearchaeota archaeon]|nr:MAG: hypothetical protein D6783_03650 [Candidatus Woesearchaeota archaeon]